MRPILDRIARFDERSREWGIRKLQPGEPRSYTWDCDTNLNQGNEGACVGFGWAQEAAARPVVVMGVTDALGFRWYERARAFDLADGANYSEGATVLAGAKTARAWGFCDEFYWSFGLDTTLAGISRVGPAVLGLNWYSGMWDTDENGFIWPTGSVVGGHCILARGVSLRRNAVLVHNSWGNGWGGTDKGPGTAWIDLKAFSRLCEEDGEVCFPVHRSQPEVAV